MVLTLLPASAAAFAPRGAPNVVLPSKVEPWLTATLKRTNKVKRPLNSVPQHQRCLTETLSGSNAIWTLCTLMLPKAPDADLRKDDNPLIEALFNHQVIYIEAYVVHVDMVSQNEVAFKLTSETIESLIEYHKEVHSVDTAASTWDWSEKEVQLKKLQENFVQAANKFVYRTNARALEGLEEEGAGELLDGRADEVKQAILGMFLPLLPPPPRIVETVPQAPILPSSTGAENWWQPTIPMSQAPMDQWKVVPSSPSTTSSADSSSGMWASMALNEIQNDYQSASPTPSFEQPFTTAAQSPPEYYSAPLSMPMSYPAMSAPLLAPSLLLPQQPCGVSAGFGGFAWDRPNDFAMPMSYAI